MCSFCDQFKITGRLAQPKEKDIDEAIENSKIKKLNSEKLNSEKLNTEKLNTENLKINEGKVFREIAFFGGSFTAIEKNYMENLLACAYKHIKLGEIDGIRISTRPDCIDDDILETLKFYGVTSIELGAQSMVDKVLFFNNRGHSAEDVVKASRLIKKYGFELGLQMMTGLYMSSFEDDLFTAREFIKLSPNTVRIYPTLIMKGTKLEYFYEKGDYNPMGLDCAVELCAKLLCLFNSNNINVIRLGLHSSEGINKNLVAGPWHPAFRELCESKILVNRCIDLIKKLNYENIPISITVPPRDVSKIIGQKKCGIKKIMGICPKVIIKEDAGLKPSNFLLKRLDDH